MKKILKNIPLTTVLGGIISAPLFSTSCSEKVITQLIAHRGAPGHNGVTNEYTFENNVESFEPCSKQNNFFGIETDVYLTKDLKWVVVHDDNPFDNGKNENERNTSEYVAGSFINDNPSSLMSYEKCISTPIVTSNAYPKFVDPGVDKKQHKLTTFGDYLDICKNGNKNAIIEIKEPKHLVGNGKEDCKGDKGYLLPYGIDGFSGYMWDLYNTIVDHKMQNNCVIISFQECYIRWLAKNIPFLLKNHQLQMLGDALTGIDRTDPTSNTDPKILVDEGFDVSIGDCDWAWGNFWHQEDMNVTSDFVKYAHKKKCKVAIWTVDVKSIAQKYENMGVDFITTDYYNFVDDFSQIPGFNH